MWNQTWPTVGQAMPPLPTQIIGPQPPLPAAPPPAEPALPAAPAVGTAVAPTAMAGPYGQYTPAQYAALTPEQQYAIQQHWHQWQVYQQEYAKWHAQYGEQYNREMAAAAVYSQPPLPAQPPPLPPNDATVAPPPPDTLSENTPKPPPLAEPVTNTAVKITAAATMYNTPNTAQPPPQNLTQQNSPWFAASNRVDYKQPNTQLIGPSPKPKSLFDQVYHPPNSWTQQAQQNQVPTKPVGGNQSNQFGNSQEPLGRNNFSSPNFNNDRNWNQGGRNNANFNQQNRLRGDNNNSFNEDNYLGSGPIGDFANEGRPRAGGGFNSNNPRNEQWGRNAAQNQNNNKWQGNNRSLDKNETWSNNKNNNMGNQQYGRNQNNNMRNLYGQQEENQNINTNNDDGNFNQESNKRAADFNKGPNNRGANFNSTGNFNRGGNFNERDGNNFNQGPVNFNRGGNFNERDVPNDRPGNFNRGRNFNEGDNNLNQGTGNFNRGGNFNERDAPNDRPGNFNERDGPNDRPGNFNERDGPNDRPGNFNRGGNFNERDGPNDRPGNFNRGANFNERDGNLNQGPGNFNRGGNFNERDGNTNQAPNDKAQTTKPDMTEEIFDRQFRVWEEQFEDWKRNNANNPDREWYNRFLAQFEIQRKTLIEKRNQIRQRRMAQLATQLSPQKSTTQQSLVQEHKDEQKENKQMEAEKPVVQVEQAKVTEIQPQLAPNAEQQIEKASIVTEKVELPKAADVVEKETTALKEPMQEEAVEERKRKMSELEDEATKCKSLRTEEAEEAPIITINLDEDEVNEETNAKMCGLFGRSEGIPGLDLVEGESNLFAAKETQEKNNDNKVPEEKAVETEKKAAQEQQTNNVEPNKPLTQQIQESSVGNLPIVINALKDPEMLQNIINVLAKVLGLNQNDVGVAQETTDQVLQQLPGLLQKLQDQRQQVPPMDNQQQQQQVPENAGVMPPMDNQQQQQQLKQVNRGREQNFFAMNNERGQFGNMAAGAQMPMNNFGPMAPQGNFPTRNLGFGVDMPGPGPNFEQNFAQNFRGNNFNNRRGPNVAGPGYEPNFNRQAAGPNFNRQGGNFNVGGPGFNNRNSNMNMPDMANKFAGNRQQAQGKKNPFRRNAGPQIAGPQAANQWRRYVNFFHFFFSNNELMLHNCKVDTTEVEFVFLFFLTRLQ